MVLLFRDGSSRAAAAKSAAFALLTETSVEFSSKKGLHALSIFPTKPTQSVRLATLMFTAFAFLACTLLIISFQLYSLKVASPLCASPRADAPFSANGAQSLFRPAEAEEQAPRAHLKVCAVHGHEICCVQAVG